MRRKRRRKAIYLSDHAAARDYALRRELDNYKAMSHVKFVDTQLDDNNVEYEARSNPLAWWKKNEKMFPTLAILARRYLCIPATSSPSERLFSTAGLTISKRRNALGDENASAIIFLNKNWGIVEDYEKKHGIQLLFLWCVVRCGAMRPAVMCCHMLSYLLSCAVMCCHVL